MDKIAIISDVHGNITALNTVLKDIKKRNINKIFCLGDSIIKCVNPDLVIDKDIKCTIFDLETINEYSVNDNSDEIIQVYTGTVREYITTHKSINTVRWIGKKDIENYNFSDEDLKIIKEYFSI